MKHGFTSWLLWQVFGMFSAAYWYIPGSLLVGSRQVIGMFPESFPSPFYLTSFIV